MTGWTGDNTLYVFRRCPAGGTPLAWSCVASNNDGGNVPYTCGVLAQVTIAAVNQSSYYVATSQLSTATWTSGLWWAYTPPTPTASPTASLTSSPSATLSAGAAASATPSGTVTASASATASATPSATLTVEPTCGATALDGVPIRAGVGARGSFPVRAPRPAAAAWAAASTCPGGGYTVINAAPTGTDLYSIDLTGLPRGGSLTVSSCSNPAFPLTVGAWGDNTLYVFSH